MFSLDQGRFQTTPIGSFRESTEYRDMISDGEKIYVLDSPWNETPYHSKGGKPYLRVYDPGTGKVDSYVLPVVFADHLMKKGDGLIGYGRIVIYTPNGDVEGTIDNYGGAFSFSLKDQTTKKLSGLPIVTMDSDTLNAKAVAEDNYSALETDMVYSPEKDRLVVSKRKKVEFTNDGPYSIYRWSNENLHRENLKKVMKEDEAFSGLQVEYQTLTENASTGWGQD